MASRVCDLSLLSLIVLNVFAVIVESSTGLPVKLVSFLNIFEKVSVIIFTVEYLLRVWACTFKPGFNRPVLGRLKFVFSFLLMVDLVAILPFYLPMLISVDLRLLRALRLLRMARLVKIERYSASLRLIGRVLKKERADIFTTIFVSMVLLLVTSSLVYMCEQNAQPEVFSSIPASMYWGIMTLTTVGYGDVYPVTMLGKVFASITAFLGIGMFALPTAILGAAFVREMSVKKNGKRKCPHCGGAIDD